MSESFLNETSLQELTELIEKTPLPVIIKAFEQVEDADIAVFLLLLDVATSKTTSGSSDEIHRTLARTGNDFSNRRSEETFTAHAQKIFAQFPYIKTERDSE